ncbi:MAG: HEAT repeat domain-containing protein [Gemmataceae bacterium]
MLYAPLLLLVCYLSDWEVGQLRELLFDRLDPRGQSQAALLLVQSKDPAAEKIIRAALIQLDNEEAFQALATAIRIKQDCRFLRELVAALVANRPRLRQVVAETLASLGSPEVVKQLAILADDPKVDLRVRQTALWTLGRTGQQAAVAVLMPHLDGPEEMQRLATAALGDLTGQVHGSDIQRWKDWWSKNKHMSREQWLEMRLSFHTSRSVRLEGELLRARAQVIRLHQMLYARLPVNERLGYLQALRDHEDPGVRALAVVFAVEMLGASPDKTRTQVLSEIVGRLTHDTNPDVQRGAVLALGRFTDAESNERLRELLRSDPPLVRAAAIRALGVQARGTNNEARARQKKVVPLLRQALEDPSLEVVIEAAEALGSLGAIEAGPVLIDLLRHPSESVRQTAAQALERSADATLLTGLLNGLEDRVATIRFCLVGALGRAATGKGKLLPADRQKMLVCLEMILHKDEDLNVRARAATVLGECGGEDQLAPLWKTVQATAPDARLPEKAWEAMLDILCRHGSYRLAESWDAELRKGKQTSRRVQMWKRLHACWEQHPDQKASALQALEAFVVAQIDDGKWQMAIPQAQTLLARSAESDEAARTRYLRLILRLAEMALAEGNKTEALRLCQEVRGYLPGNGSLAEAFESLQRKAGRE